MYSILKLSFLKRGNKLSSCNLRKLVDKDIGPNFAFKFGLIL